MSKNAVLIGVILACAGMRFGAAFSAPQVPAALSVPAAAATSEDAVHASSEERLLELQETVLKEQEAVLK